MSEQKIIIVKIGTSSLTHEDGTVNREIITPILSELVVLKQQGHHAMLVTSGAVGTGRQFLPADAFPQTASEVTRKQVLSSIGQPHLMETYQRLLNDISGGAMLASQTLLTKEHMEEPRHLLCMLDLIAEMPNVLPIINENDSVAIRELFTDNDELAGQLARLIGADHLIVLTSVGALYDRDPSRPGAKILRSYGRDDGPVETHEISPLGRGGMDSKKNAGLLAAEKGINVQIASPCETNVIGRILAGEIVGTRFYGGPSLAKLAI